MLFKKLLMGQLLKPTWHLWASSQENVSSGVCKQKSLDQPARPHGKIGASVIYLLESIITRLAARGILIF